MIDDHNIYRWKMKDDWWIACEILTIPWQLQFHYNYNSITIPLQLQFHYNSITISIPWQFYERWCKIITIVSRWDLKDEC
jgi:hypothetical protein